MKWQYIPLILFVGLGIFLLKGLTLHPQKIPSVMIGKAIPAFELPQIDGGTFSSKALKGQFTILNVWASWCATCKEEQAFLMQLAHQGVPIYGLNYKDHSSDAAEWLKHWGNPYKMIAIDRDGKISRDLGVYGAPETFLIDPNGIIRYRHIGALDEETWKKYFMVFLS